MHRGIQSFARLAASLPVTELLATTTPVTQQPLYNPQIRQIPPSSGGLKQRIVLPSADRPIKVYSFPTPEKVVVEAPSIISQIFEKVDPLSDVDPKVDPQSTVVPMIAGPRMLTIRRKKMKKHKRRKRFNRDYFKYQKYHRQKKLKAEKVFRARMHDLMQTLETFDPMDHVRDTIKRAKREWSSNLTPSGKKKYVHWSDLITLEELYHVENDDYIDKRAGLAGEEDAQRIAQLRKDYALRYSRRPAASETLAAASEENKQ